MSFHKYDTHSQSLIHLEIASRDWIGGQAYRLACLDIVCDIPLDPLAPFLQATAFPLASNPLEEHPWLNSYEKPLYHGLAWVGGQWREVTSWFTSQGYYLSVPGGGDFFISSNGQQAICLNRGEDPPALQETLLGPALILALALHGVFCLHASAVEYNGQVAVILGDSGQGKSTLAAHLGQASGWHLAADDILPVACQNGRLQARPRFPQLKIPPEQQPSLILPEVLPVSALFILSESEHQPSLQRLRARSALQALVHQTASALLFSPSLLASHLDFCARVARAVPAYRLNYPHQPQSLPAVHKLIEQMLNEAIQPGGGL